MKSGSGTAQHATRLFLEVNEHEDIAVVRCSGRICFREEALYFSRAIADLLQAGQNVVVDLSGVEVLDSAGLGELVLVHMQSQAVGNPVRLVGAHSASEKSAGIDQYRISLEIYPTIEDAQASLAVHVG